MSDTAEYAIPLFALVDSSKVDLTKPLPDALAEQLALYLEVQFGINSLSAQLLLLENQPYLVLQAVDNKSLPALCSLVDVQRTQLFRYEKADPQTVSLTPLNVKLQD